MKFKNTYKIDSLRLKGYDYSQNGAYFITICTNKRQNFFGEIKEGIIELTEVGKIVSMCWSDIPLHFPFVKLGDFVIMPNHIHGVIVIDNEDLVVETQNLASLHSNEGNNNIGNIQIQNLVDGNVETQNLVSLQYTNQFGPQSKNLASIIRGFKIGVTKFVRQNTDMHDVWQKGYYDHIIRSESSYEKITKYILENPLNWEKDSLNN